MSAVSGVVSVQQHEEGRHHEEEHVGGGVDELGDVRGEGVVLLAPVDGARPTLQVPPHLPPSSLVHLKQREWILLNILYNIYYIYSITVLNVCIILYHISTHNKHS